MPARTDLTPDQLLRLQSLGISISQPSPIASYTHQTNTNNITKPLNSSPNTGNLDDHTIPSTTPTRVLTTSNSPHLVPLLSISGLTLLSFGGLMLFKTNSDKTTQTTPANKPSTAVPEISPTQVPKSIQHYLLTSQQLFTQALSLQNSQSSPDTLASTLNQSIQSATQAIQSFPSDYRGYQQRASIYTALIDSQPQLLQQAISDYSQALNLNPSSSEISRSLASLYARQGDTSSTLQYLSRTVALEPTKAQNFYDLARIQSQAGKINDALDTYTKLLTLVADPNEIQQVRSEVASLQQLTKQAPQISQQPTSHPRTPSITSPDTSSPLIQANSGSGLIIAAPSTNQKLTVNGLSSSNSLSGNSTIPNGQTSVTINNSTLTPASQVYVSLVSGGKNLNLQVTSKTSSTFTVSLDSPANNDIVFKWWIINP